MLADCGDSGLAAHGETLLAIRTQIAWGRLDGQTLFLNCQLLKLCVILEYYYQMLPDCRSAGTRHARADKVTRGIGLSGTG
jgi:hypothetical protein